MTSSIVAHIKNYQSLQALAVGSTFYLGLKVQKYNDKAIWTNPLGKAITGTAALGTLYFSGILRDHGNSLGYGIAVPGIPGLKISLSVNGVLNLPKNIWEKVHTE